MQEPRNPTKDGPLSDVPATHETSDDTVMFVGKANDIFQKDDYLFHEALGYQAVNSRFLKGDHPEWFEPGGKRPDFVLDLKAGSRLRVLKTENLSSNGVAIAHFVEVASGPKKGVRGWIADKEIH